MNQTALTDFRERLVQLATRLQTDARSLEEEARGSSEGDNAGDLSHAPLHLGDRGTDEMLVDLNAANLENEGHLLEETLAAIERIDAGTFGKCEACGKAIAAERLEALPFARLCIDCAKQESADARPSVDRGRPHDPDDTAAPEGEMNEGGRQDQSLFDEMSSQQRERGRGDRHATGTAGGGTAFGGLAGSNEGHGDPDVADLSDAHATGEIDHDEGYDEDADGVPRSGRSGGAVGGTPVNKRSRPND